jgi:hypothetical protein
MANIIRIRRRTSGAAGAPSGLKNAELAFNEVDETLYYGKGDSSGDATSILAIAGPGAFVGLTGTQTISGSKTFSGTITFSSSVALGSSATATTQTSGDNSTKVATTAFVAAAITSAGSFTGFKITGDSGTEQQVDSSNTVTISGGTGLSSVAGSTDTITINLDNTSVTAGSYGSASAIPTFTVDAQGRLTAAGTASISTSFTVDADSGDNLTISGGDTFTIVGGTGLTSVASATDTLTLNLDNTAVTGGSYGSATAVSTFTVDAQGRLTAAGTANIAIAASAVTDFTEAAQDAVGNAVGTGLTYTDSTGAISVTANTYDAYGSASTVAGNLTTHTGATEAHGATGAVVGTTNTQTLTNKTLTSPVVSGLTLSDSSIVFEGSSADNNETTLTVTNPTADNTITLPNNSGTIITTGNLHNITEFGVLTSAIVMEGSTANDFELTISAGDPTADRTVTFPDATGTIALVADVAALSGATFTGAIAMGTNKITGLGTPTDAADAATKAYVDAVAEGLHVHESARATTNANVSIANGLENGDTFGGVTLATGDRVLLKNQTTTSENGIYVVQASGQALRAADFDTAAEVDSGDFIFVTSGTYANTGWVQTSRPATIGTDAISFTQFSGAGTFTAGNGLTINGNEFNVVGTADRIVSNGDSIDIASTYVGQSSITTLGTIATGVWNGTAIAIANGGTGSTSASGARTALELGTIATQAANNVSITGGSIDGITFDGGTF